MAHKDSLGVALDLGPADAQPQPDCLLAQLLFPPLSWGFPPYANSDSKDPMYGMKKVGSDDSETQTWPSYIWLWKQ